MRPDMLPQYQKLSALSDGTVACQFRNRIVDFWGKAYISGSFCVSMTAAIGIPKLETGPQKSAEMERVSKGFGV